MNSREFYMEVGNIDEELIIAAENYKRNRSKTVFYRIAGIAACICIILSGVIVMNSENAVYINAVSEPEASKSVIPSEENTVVVSLDYSELMSYFGTENAMDVFGDNYRITEQADYFIYKNNEGEILHDTNVLFFKNAEETKIFSVVLSTKEDFSKAFDDIKYSSIKGVSVILAEYQNGAGNTEYLAITEIGGANVKITAEGFNEKEFVDLIKQLTKSENKQK